MSESTFKYVFVPILISLFPCLSPHSIQQPFCICIYVCVCFEFSNWILRLPFWTVLAMFLPSSLLVASLAHVANFHVWLSAPNAMSRATCIMCSILYMMSQGLAMTICGNTEYNIFWCSGGGLLELVQIVDTERERLYIYIYRRTWWFS